MLAKDARVRVSHKFSALKWNIWFFDEINVILKKIILFCVLSKFHFVIKCGFAFKIALLFYKSTIFHQIRLLVWNFTEVQD